MRFLRYLGQLLKDCLGFAWENKIWWILPLVLVLLLLSALVIVLVLRAHRALGGSA